MQGNYSIFTNFCFTVVFAKVCPSKSLKIFAALAVLARPLRLSEAMAGG